MTLVTHKIVPFILVNGRYIRNHKGKPVDIKSNAKGNSMTKFPRTLGKIGYHKWA
jgi:hypothetical protein